jgi:hypothetical protein
MAMLLFPSCRAESEKCSCQLPPVPSRGELDSAFFKKSLQLRAIASIHSIPEGATVSLDKVEIGTTPFDGIKLMPGKHEVEFELGGKRTMIFLDTTINFDSGYTRFSVDLNEENPKRTH